MSVRQPAIYLPHGGGPWPIVDMGLTDSYAPLKTYLEHLPSTLPQPPKAILCVSAHWEEARPTVMSSPAPPMLYDYVGFPKAAYEFTWPAPGAPDVAAGVLACLSTAGIDADIDPDRGFDHGVFVPLMLGWPRADVPTLQLSLSQGLDPSRHLDIGHALAPLRDEGVVIVGSGMSYHNMSRFQDALRSEEGREVVGRESKLFDDWLFETVTAEHDARESALLDWAHAPGARWAHPREEHLIPLMVVAGAAAHSRPSVPFRGEVLGARVCAVHLDG